MAFISWMRVLDYRTIRLSADGLGVKTAKTCSVPSIHSESARLAIDYPIIGHYPGKYAMLIQRQFNGGPASPTVEPMPVAKPKGSNCLLFK